MNILKMNIFTSGLLGITIFFFAVAIAMFAWAVVYVKKGTHETKYDHEGRPYPVVNKNDIHHWYEHNSGKAAIIMLLLGIASIWVLPWIHFNWG